MDTISFLWLIPALPLASAVLTGFLGPTILRSRSHWPCIIATIASWVLSMTVLFAVRQHGEAGLIWKEYYTWFQTGDLHVGFALRADALTAVMLAFVTFISSLIAIYSVGYMHGEEGYARYFAEVSLFIFSMTLLVLADNFLLLYTGWELVGLCSYLLIGFWYNRASAAAAARKAFLVTRIGDFGFILGIILLWTTFGPSISYEDMFARVQAGAAEHHGVIVAACLLLFCGAMGKSAQFPLHVWLPDAMEGPSSVSALIHAATMVTAGVYMVARCMPIFRETTAALAVVSGIGAFTALLAAVIALTQTDLKRVLAYSTVSQLGYMFMALGCGTTKHFVTIAVVAAIFHMVTHAFFKALLFLGAGSVMHGMGNVIDMRRFGGLRRVLPVTHWTFLCGAAALAGFPLLSAFWSKDEILATAFEASGAGNPNAGLYLAVFIVGLVTAFLTAFYTFRAYFLTFWGEERIPEEAGHHVHESPEVMLWPLRILAVGAVALGAIIGPTAWLGSYLTLTPRLEHLPEHGVSIGHLVLSSFISLGGIALAWWMYACEPGMADRLAQRFVGLYHLSLNKLYLDEIYVFLFVMPLTALATLARVFDLHLLDGVIDLIAQVPRYFAMVFRPIQNGLVQFYALAMVLGTTVLLAALVYSLAG
jgi:NADH-quinone oxidoreductase subunit L